MNLTAYRINDVDAKRKQLFEVIPQCSIFAVHKQWNIF